MAGGSSLRVADQSSGELAVCQVVPSINQLTGGTAVSVPALAENLSSAGIHSYLATLDYTSLGDPNVPEGTVLISRPASLMARRLRGFSPGLKRDLRDVAMQGIDLIHNHALWMAPNLYARQIAREIELPLVVSPRGMLETWSLNHSMGRKRLAWWLYERANLRAAAAFHATSPDEAKSIRRLGFRQAIAMIPNGVELPEEGDAVPRDVLEEDHPELRNAHWLLFMSRLHPKKGIDSLIRVWADISAGYPDWHLILAGPDLSGYKPHLLNLVSSLSIESRVTFTDSLEGNRKRCALSNSELFVLPTHSENFGIVIAEALAHGMPAITTRGAPWRDLKDHHCGWWIEDNEKALRTALEEGLSCGDGTRREMGERGRALVAMKYSWRSIADQMADFYRWICRGGSPPGWVLLSER